MHPNNEPYPEHYKQRTAVLHCQDDEKCNNRWGAITLNYFGRGITKYLCHWHWLKHKGIDLEGTNVQRRNRTDRSKRK